MRKQMTGVKNKVLLGNTIIDTKHDGCLRQQRNNIETWRTLITFIQLSNFILCMWALVTSCLCIKVHSSIFYLWASATCLCIKVIIQVHFVYVGFSHIMSLY